MKLQAEGCAIYESFNGCSLAQTENLFGEHNCICLMIHENITLHLA